MERTSTRNLAEPEPEDASMPEHERKPERMTSATPPLLVVMGVSGSGKSTVGRVLARDLGVDFVDGDDLHQGQNSRGPSAGAPPAGDDRWPWLGEVGRMLRGREGSGLVVACSALRRSYRNVVRWEAPGVRFVHLAGPKSVIAQRLGTSEGGFTPPVLEDQYAQLEPLEDDESGITVDAATPPELISAAVLRALERS